MSHSDRLVLTDSVDGFASRVDRDPEWWLEAKKEVEKKCAEMKEVKAGDCWKVAQLLWNAYDEFLRGLSDAKDADDTAQVAEEVIEDLLTQVQRLKFPIQRLSDMIEWQHPWVGTDAMAKGLEKWGYYIFDFERAEVALLPVRDIVPNGDEHNLREYFEDAISTFSYRFSAQSKIKTTMAKVLKEDEGKRLVYRFSRKSVQDAVDWLQSLTGWLPSTDLLFALADKFALLPRQAASPDLVDALLKLKHDDGTFVFIKHAFRDEDHPDRDKVVRLILEHLRDPHRPYASKSVDSVHFDEISNVLEKEILPAHPRLSAISILLAAWIVLHFVDDFLFSIFVEPNSDLAAGYTERYVELWRAMFYTRQYEERRKQETDRTVQMALDRIGPSLVGVLTREEWQSFLKPAVFRLKIRFPRAHAGALPEYPSGYTRSYQALEDWLNTLLDRLVRK